MAKKIKVAFDLIQFTAANSGNVDRNGCSQITFVIVQGTTGTCSINGTVIYDAAFLFNPFGYRETVNENEWSDTQYQIRVTGDLKVNCLRKYILGEQEPK